MSENMKGGTARPTILIYIYIYRTPPPDFSKYHHSKTELKINSANAKVALIIE